jgi:uncharacterized protein YjbJ (UPF0337 family)
MDQDTTDAEWNQFLDRVKERWGRLTVDDLDQLGGRDELVAAVEQRYGVTKHEAAQQVRSFEDTYHCGQRARSNRLAYTPEKFGKRGWDNDKRLSAAAGLGTSRFSSRIKDPASTGSPPFREAEFVGSLCS